MKKQFFLYKLGVIPLILLFCSVNAQTNQLDANLNNSSSKEVTLNENAMDREVPFLTAIPVRVQKPLKISAKPLKKLTMHPGLKHTVCLKLNSQKMILKQRYFMIAKEDGLQTSAATRRTNYQKISGTG